jgi:site-specific recombinase XerD
MRSLAPSEIRFLLQVISPRSPFGIRNRAMFILLLHIGLRVSEFCGLRISDVLQWGAPRKMLDLPAHLAKGRKARLIPLNTTAREMISLLVRFNQARGFSIAPEAPLLVNRYGKPLSVRTFQHLVQRYREAAQLSSRITPHSFRHTLATELVRATGNVRVTQAILGHKRLSSTQIYVHPSPRDLEKAMNTIG